MVNLSIQIFTLISFNSVLWIADDGLEIAESLIQNCADVNAKEKRFEGTPLHDATNGSMYSLKSESGIAVSSEQWGKINIFMRR